MRASIYERRGPAREVLRIVDRPIPEPAAGEVRVKIAVSALNPTDIKARSVWLGQTAMPSPLVTPHRDGAGIVDKVGDGVDPARVGERVWLSVLDRARPFGTAYSQPQAEIASISANNAKFGKRRNARSKHVRRLPPAFNLLETSLRQKISGFAIRLQLGADGFGHRRRLAIPANVISDASSSESRPDANE
jgi:NADPH:quinone reductase-like Zn-dependent oxidoreductase